MTSTLPRIAGTAVLALIATALTLPLAPAATAVTPVDRVWTVSYVQADDSYGLFYADGAGGTPTKVDGSANSSVSHIASAADGSRVIYLRLTYVPSVDDVKQEIVVRDTSTRQVRVLDSRLYSTDVFLDVPALSPDGTKAVWESYDDVTGVFSVRKALVGSGSATTLDVADHTPYAFLDNDTVLVQTPEGTAFTESFSGGATHTVTGLPADAINVTVSPDGTKLAWALMTSMTAPYASTLQVAPVTVNPDGSASVGAASTLDATGYNRQPAFSRDGSTLYYVQTSGATDAAGDVVSIPAAGGTPSPIATAADDSDVTTTAAPSADVTAPTDAVAQPATLNGTSATVRWSLPSETDLSGVVVSRAGKSVFVPAPQTSYVDTGLTLGTTYAYTFTTVDRSGNLASGVSRSVTALLPRPVFADPTSLTSTRTAFPVTFAGAAPSSTRYNVDYLIAGTTTWKHWVLDAQGRVRAFGAPATTGVAATTSIAGGSYSFKVQVRDAFGNASGWVTSSRAVVPYDQTKATLSGGTNATSSAAYLGSFRKLASTSSYARVTLVGNRLQVIGMRCAGCGKFAIYAGSTKIATVDTYASSTKARQVLFTKTYTSSATRTFTIRPLGTPGRPTVALDGFAMRR
ncbi:MAG TPA: fibronectin type III domain-containing protein [Mycobacteriales bacterium]|nr:fibronectin type III domain-containing protein [Mycobacteriales bacterium]